jgi:hypothetical protein
MIIAKTIKLYSVRNPDGSIVLCPVLERTILTAAVFFRAALQSGSPLAIHDLKPLLSNEINSENNGTRGVCQPRGT